MKVFSIKFHENRPVGAELPQAVSQDGRTDMTKIKGTFRGLR